MKPAAVVCLVLLSLLLAGDLVSAISPPAYAFERYPYRKKSRFVSCDRYRTIEPEKGQSTRRCQPLEPGQRLASLGPIKACQIVLTKGGWRGMRSICTRQLHRLSVGLRETFPRPAVDYTAQVQRWLLIHPIAYIDVLYR